MRVGRGVLIAASLSVFPIIVVVTELTLDSTKPRRQRGAASVSENALETATPAPIVTKLAARNPALLSRSTTRTVSSEVARIRSEPLPALNPQPIAAPAQPAIDPTEPENPHTNLAALSLRAAFQRRAGDMTGAERSEQQIEQQKALLAAKPATDASVE